MHGLKLHAQRPMASSRFVVQVLRITGIVHKPVAVVEGMGHMGFRALLYRVERLRSKRVKPERRRLAAVGAPALYGGRDARPPTATPCNHRSRPPGIPLITVWHACGSTVTGLCINEDG